MSMAEFLPKNVICIYQASAAAYSPVPGSGCAGPAELGFGPETLMKSGSGPQTPGRVLLAVSSTCSAASETSGGPAGHR